MLLILEIRVQPRCTDFMRLYYYYNFFFFLLLRGLGCRPWRNKHLYLFLTGCFYHFIFLLLFPGPMFVPGASSPGDQTPLETFVNDSVSRSLIEYFEGKGDSGKQVFVANM